MNAEFQWWLLLVGLVIGALLVFLVMVDFTRSADEQAEAELGREAEWIAGVLRPTDGPLDPGLIQEILRLNREWLAGATGPLEAPVAPEPALAQAGVGTGSADWQPGPADPADMEGDGTQR
jgi:hypothetical protein